MALVRWHERRGRQALRHRCPEWPEGEHNGQPFVSGSRDLGRPGEIGHRNRTTANPPNSKIDPERDLGIDQSDASHGPAPTNLAETGRSRLSADPAAWAISSPLPPARPVPLCHPARTASRARMRAVNGPAARRPNPMISVAVTSTDSGQPLVALIVSATGNALTSNGLYYAMSRAYRRGGGTAR